MAAKLCFRCKNVPSKWQNVEFEWRNDHLKISMRVAVIVGDSDGGIFFSVAISKLYKIFRVSQRHYKAAMHKCSG